MSCDDIQFDIVDVPRELLAGFDHLISLDLFGPLVGDFNLGVFQFTLVVSHGDFVDSGPSLDLPESLI